MQVCLCNRLMEAAFCLFSWGVCRGWAMFCRLINAACKYWWALCEGNHEGTGFNAKCPQWKTSNETAQRQTEQQAPSALSDWPHTNSGLLLFPCASMKLCAWNWWKVVDFSLRVPPCVQKGERPLPTECNKGSTWWIAPHLCYGVLHCCEPAWPFPCLYCTFWHIFCLWLCNTSDPSAPPHLRDTEVLMQRLLAVVVVGGGPFHCLLLSRIALQLSDQDWSRLWGGLVEMCLLWQAVNRMCSHAGLDSTPDWETQWAAGIT